MIDGTAAISIAGLIDLMRDHALGKERVKRLYLFVFRQVTRDLHRAHEKA